MTDKDFVDRAIHIVESTMGGYDWGENVAIEMEELVTEYKEQRGEV